jgi:tRNA nucleotidyltransferase (CCA-adding enzyme)
MVDFFSEFERLVPARSTGALSGCSDKYFTVKISKNHTEVIHDMDIVTTHRNTDFDAFASVIAGSILYPEAVPVLPKNMNPNVKAFLSMHKDMFPLFHPDEVAIENTTRLIVMDVNRWQRLEGMKVLRERSDIEIHLWDHHGGGGDIEADWQCVEEIGATITLLIRRLKEQRKILTPMQATLFLAGIYEDTGAMTFPSTTAEDVYAAAYLLERKADLKIIGTFLRPAYGEKQKDVLFTMLQSAARIKVNGYSVSINTVPVNGHVDSLALVVRMYRDILNVDAAVGIFANEENGKCMVIARSDAEGIDVGAIMRSLGGGGHPGAASAMLKSVEPKAIEELVLELIQGNRQASVQISDLMSFPVFQVQVDTSMAEVAKILRDKGCTGLPVVENDRLVGIISRRDFRKIKKEENLKAPVKAYMNKNVLTIEPGRSPMEAAKIMVKNDVGRLPVVDDGRMIGIITRSDSMMYFYDLLPD